MTYNTQVVMPMDSGIGADVCVNTFHMEDSGLVGPSEIAKIQSWHTALQTFYNAFSGYLSGGINPAAVRMKTFNLDDDSPRVAVVDEIKPFTSTGGSVSLPHELAIVLSFNSLMQSGIKPSHRRGRIFIGPLDRTAENAGATDCTVVAAARTAITGAANTLMDAGAADPGPGWFWATHSSFAASNAQPAVVAGYVDDAFDIQRRRGTKPTVKTTFS